MSFAGWDEFGIVFNDSNLGWQWLIVNNTLRKETGFVPVSFEFWMIGFQFASCLVAMRLYQAFAVSITNTSISIDCTCSINSPQYSEYFILFLVSKTIATSEQRHKYKYCKTFLRSSTEMPYLFSGLTKATVFFSEARILLIIKIFLWYSRMSINSEFVCNARFAKNIHHPISYNS